MDDKFNSTHGGTFKYGFEVDRINWKGMDQESRRCDMDNYETGTTKCITQYVEKEVGCRTMMSESNANLTTCSTSAQIDLLLRRTSIIQGGPSGRGRLFVDIALRVGLWSGETLNLM